jgi:hypothetical protein
MRKPFDDRPTRINRPPVPLDDRFTRIGSRPVSLEDRLARIARLRRLTLEKSAADLLAAQMPEHLTTALDQPAS